MTYDSGGVYGSLPVADVATGPSVSTGGSSQLRARAGGVELRDAGGMPVLHGHFAVFGPWARIDSAYEGTFMERIAPGAFTKTFTEDRTRIRALFQHGRDPQIGDKPLGPIEVLEEDSVGAHYEVALLDTNYVREIIPGLQAGLYGASFRFTAEAEEFNQRPERSEHNPEAIAERTVTEAKVHELSPVTFPAYPEATAGVRSLTDWYRTGETADRPTIWTPSRRRARLLTL